MSFKISTALKLSADVGTIQKATDLIPVIAESVVLDVNDIHVKPELQFRLETTEVHGFHVEAARIDEMAEFVIQKAMQGIASEDAFPSISVGRKGDEKLWLAGGQHRCAAIKVAREWIKADKLPMSVLLIHAADAKTDARELAELVGGIRAEIYELRCEDDFRILAGRENGNAQHGEKLTPKERRAVIERGLLENPRMPQLSDNAAAVVLTGSTATRGTVQNVRKVLVKDGKIDDVKDRIGLDGVFKKVRRPGALALDKLNVAAQKLAATTEKVQGIIDGLHDSKRIAPTQLRAHAHAEANFESKLSVCEKWMNDKEKERAQAFLAENALTGLGEEEADASDASAQTETSAHAQESPQTETDDAGGTSANANANANVRERIALLENLKMEFEFHMHRAADVGIKFGDVGEAIGELFAASLADYAIEGYPTTHQDAILLATQHPHDFANWAVTRLGLTPTPNSNDGGFDGTRKVLLSENQRLAEPMLVIAEVKSGRSLTPNQVRAFRTAMRDVNAAIGIFITLHPVTRGMKNLAEEEGTIEHNGRHYPRLQFWQITDTYFEEGIIPVNLPWWMSV